MVSISDVRKKAKTLGVVGGKMKKDELIRAIQKSEGNFPCFKNSQGQCDQNECLWREDCFSKE